MLILWNRENLEYKSHLMFPSRVVGRLDKVALVWGYTRSLHVGGVPFQAGRWFQLLAVRIIALGLLAEKDCTVNSAG